MKLWQMTIGRLNISYLIMKYISAIIWVIIYLQLVDISDGMLTTGYVVWTYLGAVFYPFATFAWDWIFNFYRPQTFLYGWAFLIVAIFRWVKFLALFYFSPLISPIVLLILYFNSKYQMNHPN